MNQRIGSARLVALAVAAGLLAACGSVGVLPSPTPSQHVATARPAMPASVPSSTPGVSRTGSPDEIAALVAATVPNDRPRLLPRSLPAPMVARASITPDGYMVSYADDLHTKEITFVGGWGINPPMPPADAASGSRQFRGVRASYLVYEPASATSRRYLDWQEPGSWVRLPSGAVPDEMLLEAAGLTEAEFFGVADSVAPVG